MVGKIVPNTVLSGLGPACRLGLPNGSPAFPLRPSCTVLILSKNLSWFRWSHYIDLGCDPFWRVGCHQVYRLFQRLLISRVCYCSVKPSFWHHARSSGPRLLELGPTQGPRVTGLVTTCSLPTSELKSPPDLTRYPLLVLPVWPGLIHRRNM